MPLVFEDGIVRFDGHCLVDEALVLLDGFKISPAAVVDLGGCTSLHAALLQVLASAQPEIVALPEDRLLAAIVRRAVGKDST